MPATIGADDLDLFASPHPELLHAITGIAPVPQGTHVLLEAHGVRSAQRLAAGDVGGTLWIALWPGELKAQATYLYGRRLGRPMIAAARAQGWTAAPSPHLAFRNSPPGLRLYMAPALDALEYARRWEDGDLQWVGAHSRTAVRTRLWAATEEARLRRRRGRGSARGWLSRVLGRRDALMRPGLRLKRECGAATADELRREVDAILAAAGEPPLPATRAGRPPAREIRRT